MAHFIKRVLMLIAFVWIFTVSPPLAIALLFLAIFSGIF